MNNFTSQRESFFYPRYQSFLDVAAYFFVTTTGFAKPSGDRDGEVVAESPNLVEQTNNPVAHAKTVAIEQVCERTQSEGLSGRDVYVMAHPCPTYLGALSYCSPDRVVSRPKRRLRILLTRITGSTSNSVNSTTNTPRTGTSGTFLSSTNRTTMASTSTNAGRRSTAKLAVFPKICWATDRQGCA